MLLVNHLSRISSIIIIRFGPIRVANVGAPSKNVAIL